jgi:hypothetical protein
VCRKAKRKRVLKLAVVLPVAKLNVKIRGVLSQCGLAIYNFKKYNFKAKEELWKFKYFTMQKFNLPQKNPSKRNQNPSRYYYNSVIIINLNFQHKPKYHLSKILVYKNRHIIT